MADLTVGQTLWYVPKHGKPHEITAQKIGRKWAETTTRGKLNMQTLQIFQGDFMCGQCYADRAKWQYQRDRELAMQTFKTRVNDWGFGRDLSLDQIKQAAAILGIELPERTND